MRKISMPTIVIFMFVGGIVICTYRKVGWNNDQDDVLLAYASFREKIPDVWFRLTVLLVTFSEERVESMGGADGFFFIPYSIYSPS